MPYLVLKDNQRMFWRLPEPSAKFSIGRISDNDLAILDPQVSRQHAALEPEGEGWIIRDNGSANGTFLNGEPTKQEVLKPGDELRFGKTIFIFELEAPYTDDDTDY
jgi:pSer/pThr/pTyr-binding forkhead associated (FHA) protein